MAILYEKTKKNANIKTTGLGAVPKLSRKWEFFGVFFDIIKVV